MIELFVALLIGGFAVYLFMPKQKELLRQIEAQKAKVVDMQNDLDYYKKLCKTISEENAEFRRNK